jgi:hypothetical protein
VNLIGMFLGAAVLLVFGSLVILFTALAVRRREADRQPAFRPIGAYARLADTVGHAVETGRRLHLSLGTGTLGTPDTTITAAGATLFDQVAPGAAMSDRPPIVTAADGATMLLGRDVLRGVYARHQALERFPPDAAQVVGLSPLSFGAALATLPKDEAVAGTVLMGSVGLEAVLLAEANARAGSPTLAATDNLAAQAMLLPTTTDPVLGEDVYAAGAYVFGAPAHIGSLHAQDVMRLLVAGAILAGVLYRTVSSLAAFAGGG